LTTIAAERPKAPSPEPEVEKPNRTEQYMSIINMNQSRTANDDTGFFKTHLKTTSQKENSPRVVQVYQTRNDLDDTGFFSNRDENTEEAIPKVEELLDVKNPKSSCSSSHSLKTSTNLWTEEIK
jgi:hypothetical protein